MSNPILTVFDDAGNAIPIPAFPWATDGGGGASNVTDEIITVAGSQTTAEGIYEMLYPLLPADVASVVLFWQGDTENAPTDQLLWCVFPMLVTEAVGRMMYARWRNSTYDVQSNSNSAYNLTINAGDTFRMVAIK